MDLPLIFALVIALGVAIYVIADGFDLGIGILFLFAPRDADRDLMMESVAPLWDGNETWLVMGGTLLLAAFAPGYYILLPALYLPIVFMLFALILRGVAFEFRFQAGRFRRVWDFVFAGGSVLAALCQGFVLGGFIQGVPIRDGMFAGGPLDFVSILGLLCGVGLIGGYALLGAGWLIWKTSGATQVFGREVGHAALILTMALMALVSLWTALTVPAVADRWFAWPQMLPEALLPLAAAATAIVLWRTLWSDRDFLPFLLGIALFLLGFAGLAVSLWPYVVPRQITIWQAAGDPATLKVLLVGVVIILPIVIAYTLHAYWVFRGKTVASEDSAYGDGPAVSTRRCSSMDTKLHLS
ncbi:MAG: cytochrome d ubiquinol oxidase subunit II [Acetobacteraceae bacterium]